MDNQRDIDHNKLHLEDTLALLGELEHMRYHALRSAHALHGEEAEFAHLVTASTAQSLRRQIQSKVGEISDEDWCELKSAQRIRQLNYETMEGDTETFNALENLVDTINSRVLRQDMSKCYACHSDRVEVE